MALRVNTTANVLLRELDTHGAEKADTTASVAVKRKFGDTTCVNVIALSWPYSPIGLMACMASGPLS